ncbi:glycoside hydrolase family 16 protein [Actinocorallia sp. B10E7]|uniref:glycoside hydrolase family 16 protein n=1 Tax=Actinocorallia sp. B10E7 TaxID=3153558 RepID=UPI00325F36D8
MSRKKKRGSQSQLLVALLAGSALAAGTVVHVRDVETVRQQAEPQPAVDPDSVQPADGDWKLVWSDEFNRKGLPHSSKWFVQTGDRNGWGVGGLAYYDPEQVQMNGQGQLDVTAVKDGSGQKCWYGPCQYRSGRLQTSGRFTHTYGRFAARVKFPTGKGVFPAFWLQTMNASYGGERYGEIDIAEVYGLHNRDILGAAHQKKKMKDTRVVLDTPLHEQYVTVGVDWTPQGVRWWTGDDQKTFGKMKKYPNWSLDQPMQMILNLQIGGDWQGPPDGNTVFPAVMSVDWVRVYMQKEAASLP